MPLYITNFGKLTDKGFILGEYLGKGSVYDDGYKYVILDPMDGKTKLYNLDDVLFLRKDSRQCLELDKYTFKVTDYMLNNIDKIENCCGKNGK